MYFTLCLYCAILIYMAPNLMDEMLWAIEEKRK